MFQKYTETRNTTTKPIVKLPTQIMRSNESPPIAKSKKIKTSNMILDFQDNEFYYVVSVPVDTFEIPQSVLSVVDYFNKFFSPYLVEPTVMATNQYSFQVSKKSILTTDIEVTDFLAMEQLPHDRSDDKYYKVRPVLDIIKQNCNAVQNECRQAIDEMMMPFKGTWAGNQTQNAKSKPKKWGFKIFVRASVSGFIYDFIVYGGPDTFRKHVFSPAEESFGFGPKVVLGLCKTLSDPCLTSIYFDNYFTSLKLLHHLRNQYGILVLGTIRRNRIRNYQIDEGNRKPKHGSSCDKADNEKKKKLDISCPNIVKEYNLHLGGADLVDMLIALYWTAFRAKKMAHSIVLPDYRYMCITQTLKEFRLAVAESLLKKDRTSRIIRRLSGELTIQTQNIPRPSSDIRYDVVDYLPVCWGKGRCMHSKSGQCHTKYF
ncbi:hypothetical protein PR048_017821 [Dryococelus australis]|uniref:PiggyBac transposable element-derived protein domain-containing protein n=1 Tax=Dryococelus australis TaxID=614101 RepID=A0ABQ9HAL3_9NEOP|nr:hypothetical protein PR048_017821 [Dryococelus australis]